MKAAAEFLSGKYPSAAKAAEAHSVPGPNVSYYVRTWRGSDAVDVMIERLVDADDAAGSSLETNRDPQNRPQSSSQWSWRSVQLSA